MDLGLLSRFLRYWLNAIEEHSLHSPFIYELYKEVINAKYPDPVFEKIESIREGYLADTTKVSVNDLGAGSKTMNQNNRSISEIANNSLSAPKLSQLLYRLIRQQEAKEVIELGTSLGINTLYMYAGNENMKLTSFEGDDNVANYAKNTFEKFGAEGISIKTGELDKTLSNHLAFSGKIDFAFIDANHTYESTIKYFKLIAKKVHDESLVVIGDIHWSKGMEKAWNEIKNIPYATLTLDVFEAGLVFFKPDINKQHYVLEF